jgi:ComF family protein
MALSALERAQELGRAVLDWVYPPHCVHCGRPLAPADRRILCADCEDDLRGSRIVEPFCSTCGVPLPGGDECGLCRQGAQTFDVGRSLFRYSGPVGALIRSFKYEGAYHLGAEVVDRFVQPDWLPEDIGDVDCAAPVPLHPRRRRERGYDQAKLLAEAFCGQWGWPLQDGALRRTRYTESQTGHNRRDRWLNVHGAFQARSGAVEGRHVLLIDDVMTTGATASACAAAVRQAGGEKVSVLTLTRAGQ